MGELKGISVLPMDIYDEARTAPVTLEPAA
jgi:hypothetical protein